MFQDLRGKFEGFNTTGTEDIECSALAEAILSCIHHCHRAQGALLVVAANSGFSKEGSGRH